MADGPYKVIRRYRDLDYPQEDWYEVWFRDQSLVCGFSINKKDEADAYCEACNTEYATISGF